MALCAVFCLAVGCGAPSTGGPGDATTRQDVTGDAGVGRDGDRGLPYATEVVEFSPGPGAGHGQDDFPGIVFGPPQPKASGQGSLDVLSLGANGEIVLGFGDRAIVDGDGADFIVFENPFYVGGNPEQVYAELAEVSVSPDGKNWKTFDCDTEPAEPGRWPGCAGWRPTRSYDPERVDPLEPAVTGGDPFDLEEIDVERARYVRIRDVSKNGPGPTTGFDLDAVGFIHGTPDDSKR